MCGWTRLLLTGIHHVTVGAVSHRTITQTRLYTDSRYHKSVLECVIYPRQQPYWLRITVPSDVFKSYILKKIHTYTYTLHIWPNRITQACVTLYRCEDGLPALPLTEKRTELMLPVHQHFFSCHSLTLDGGKTNSDVFTITVGFGIFVELLLCQADSFRG